MAKTYHEPINGKMKITESKGDKTPIPEKKIAGVVGYPHSNVRIDTGVNIEDGKTYKRVLPDYGAAGYMGKRRPKKGTV